MEMILKRKSSFQNEKETSLLFDRPLLKQDIFLTAWTSTLSAPAVPRHEEYVLKLATQAAPL